jgi:hypothetical protein
VALLRRKEERLHGEKEGLQQERKKLSPGAKCTCTACIGRVEDGQSLTSVMVYWYAQTRSRCKQQPQRQPRPRGRGRVRRKTGGPVWCRVPRSRSMPISAAIGSMLWHGRAFQRPPTVLTLCRFPHARPGSTGAVHPRPIQVLYCLAEAVLCSRLRG